jgi:hypothetical protein
VCVLIFFVLYLYALHGPLILGLIKIWFDFEYQKGYKKFLAFWSIFSFDYTVCKMLKPQSFLKRPQIPRLLVVHPFQKTWLRPWFIIWYKADIMIYSSKTYSPLDIEPGWKILQPILPLIYCRVRVKQIQTILPLI